MFHMSLTFSCFNYNNFTSGIESRKGKCFLRPLRSAQIWLNHLLVFNAVLNVSRGIEAPGST